MSRTALVTAGTRGIGLVISATLKQARFAVAANYSGNNYSGNDAAVKACEEANGVQGFKFEVSDFDSVGVTPPPPRMSRCAAVLNLIQIDYLIQI